MTVFFYSVEVEEEAKSYSTMQGEKAGYCKRK